MLGNRSTEGTQIRKTVPQVGEGRWLGTTREEVMFNQSSQGEYENRGMVTVACVSEMPNNLTHMWNLVSKINRQTK